MIAKRGLLVLAALAATLLLGGGNRTLAQTIELPQSVRLDHERTIAYLTRIAQRGGATASIAEKAASFLKTHYAKEEAFIFAPLAVLPDLVEGRPIPNAQQIIAMAERTRAARAELYQEHTQITTLMNELIEAATKESDRELANLATRMAMQSLHEVEVLQPTTILIGEYLRKIGAGQ